MAEKGHKDKGSILALAVFFITANLFTVYFISQERYIYFWDFITYWSKYTYLSEHFIGDTLNAIETVFWSIRENNYNYLAACFLIPFGLLFGTSRLAYILSIVNIYALPAVYTFILLHKRISGTEKNTPFLLSLITVGVILLSPDFWNPILFGFVDVGGVFLTNLIFLLYLKNPYSKQRTRDLLLIAVLVTLLVLFRRWYAFWGVSFYFVLFMEICLTAFLTRPFDVKKFINGLLKFAAQASVSAAIFFIAAPIFGRRILGTDYTDLNSAYRYSENLFQSFEVVLKSFGMLYFSLFLLGSIAALIDKRTRKFAIFVLVQSLVIFVLFARTQDFDSHHRYLLLPPVILFSSFFLSRLTCKIKNFRLLTLGSLAALFLLNFLTAFGLPEIGGPKEAYPAVFTDIRHQPLVRHDFKEIERLLNVLEGLLTGSDDRVYVLASSYILNCNILDSAYLSLNRHKDIAKKILWTNGVDKREGYPQTLLSAKYVIVADPIQYHLKPQDQLSMGIPAELVLKGEGIGASFNKLPYKFNLDESVKVYIYKKIKPIRDSDAADLSEMLRQYYPDRENVYQIKKDKKD